jgi:formate--tetrahydrofolate ligase
MSALRPIRDVALQLGLDSDDLIQYGDDKAKIRLAALDREPRRLGRLVLVSAITPTRGGEGKTTVAIALAMAMRALGRNSAVALREPSLGPVFGVKGGGTGGGAAQVLPADDINLHFTGDLHAVTAAHNLLAALVDNELHFGSPSGLRARRISWPRVLDVDDRALRNVVTGLGGNADGVPRESRFDITAASEVMAVLCLADSSADLRARLGRMVVGQRDDLSDVTADDLGAADAMHALLKDALLPNLVQDTEGGPAFVHGGPFANIAHGCSSVLSTKLALRYADEVVTEAGFGFELGGEKFLDIKCRQAGLWPRCVVLVVTTQALEAHGGGSGPAAVARGLAHLDRQIANVRAFGLEPVVALNVFAQVPEHLYTQVEAHCREQGLVAARCTGFTAGGSGATELAERVLAALNATDGTPPRLRFLYDLDAPYLEKLNVVARTMYGASGVSLSSGATRELARLTAAGHGALPICIAKTPLSLSTDPDVIGVPTPFDAHVTQVRLAAGAGFVVALMGAIETMPGLPRDPAARRVRVGADGRVAGLMQGD